MILPTAQQFLSSQLLSQLQPLGNKAAMELPYSRSILPRQPLYLVLILFTIIIIATIALRMEQYMSGWYSTGKFVKYHMDMTPAFYMQNAPVREIPTQDLGYNAVILYLISVYHLRDLMLSLSYLYTNVPMHPWPIILFYADDMDDTVLRTEFMLRLYDFLGGSQDVRWFMNRIEFIRIEWALPWGISHDKVKVDPVFIDHWPGYHLMCGFFASHIFDHPRLRDVTYYMRLDTDSYIFKPVCYDPIALFHERNRTYGYRSRTTDPAWVTIGMWDLTDEFVSARPGVERTLCENGWEWPSGRVKGKMGEDAFPTYYNNFEIVKLEAFRRPDVREWLDEIERVPERIYKYRWGDAPIRYATVNMYFDVKKDVEEYCGIQYWHNGVQGNKCACEDQKRDR
ncbi:hypothetical protein EW145_g2248 [Phellinidium pouzarii]|uniref:Uncharacterized protein n=1 Tax=Phellinidium pouzarii TaxID=167371 RepID=A0A4S4LC38_9AGAM|nr:hypothetical protein EW145_g2248 [Phellinidium pouzarii]